MIGLSCLVRRPVLTSSSLVPETSMQSVKTNFRFIEVRNLRFRNGISDCVKKVEAKEGSEGYLYFFSRKRMQEA